MAVEFARGRRPFSVSADRVVILGGGGRLLWHGGDRGFNFSVSPIRPSDLF